MSEPSALFMDIVTIEHSPSIDCQFCKRTHFTHEAEDRDGLREKAKAMPDKYLENSDDQIAWGFLDGRQYVYGCPCNGAARYEEFIWRHRVLISKYLRRRAEEIVAEADRDLALTRDLI